MTKIKSRIIARPTGVKSLVLFGVVSLFATSYAIADTSYSVSMAATGFFTLPTDTTHGNPTGTDQFPATGYCSTLLPTGLNSSVLGTLTLLSGGGLTLTFGAGLNAVGGCGASLTGSVVNTTPGTYTTLSGHFYNDTSTNPTEPGSAGFVPSQTNTYFVVADDFPPPGSCSTNCTNGGSLDFLLKIQNPTSSVPEPSSASTGLIGLSLLGLGMLVRRRIATR